MEVNILEDWKKEFIWQSSSLNPNKVCQRHDIEKLYYSLVQYFGLDFFCVKINQANNLDKLNWIINLLAQQDVGSLIALFEIVNILEYSKGLSNEIQYKLKSHLGSRLASNSIREFQNLFFELYIYRLFDENKIKNNKKIWIGPQEVEGECWIGEKKFLFECKKAYTAAYEEFDLVTNLGAELYLLIQRVTRPRGVQGFINLSNNFRKAKNELLKSINRFFQSSADTMLIEEASFTCRIEGYDPLLFEETYQSVKSPSILFRMIPPPVIVPNSTNNYRFEIRYCLSVNNKKVTDKLIKIISDKRKQHKNIKDENWILFIDNELQKNMKFPLIPPGERMIDDAINSYLKEKNIKDIICIVNRDYTRLPIANSITVYCQEDDNDVKQILENLNLNFDYKIV